MLLCENVGCGNRNLVRPRWPSFKIPVTTMLVSDTSLHVFLLAETQKSIPRVDVSIKSMKSNLCHHHRYRETQTARQDQKVQKPVVSAWTWNLTGLQIAREATARCVPAFMKPQSYPVLCQCSSLKIREKNKKKNKLGASQGCKLWETTISNDSLEDWAAGRSKQRKHRLDRTAPPPS